MLHNRGSYDFEAFDWVNPRCCGLLFKHEGKPVFQFVHDYGMSLKPRQVAIDALKAMLSIAKQYAVKNWFAHNGGKYDVCMILTAVSALNLKARGHIAGGRVVSLAITDNEVTINLFDSMAVIPGALKKVAKDFELKSQKLLGDDDYSVDVRQWTLQRMEVGCRADCEVVLEALETVETMLENEGGELRSTFSASSFSVLKAKVDLPDTRKWVAENKLARLAYFGGRVEVFKHLPDETLSEWDVNSSYPWSMSQPDLPWQLKGMLFGSEARRFYDSGEPCIVEASVYVPANVDLPVLPFRLPEGGMYFPTGKWTGYFTSDELHYAEETGNAVARKINSAIAYTSASPFGDFIKEFYRLKSEGKGAVRNLYKLILNGCYGKFAQKPEKEVLRIFDSQETAFDFLMSRPPDTTRMLSNSDMRFLGVSQYLWSKHTHYALAAFITARSRMLLHKRLSEAKGIAYCDTDSVHASAKSTLPTGNALGELKLEIEKMTAEYYAPKIYVLKPEGEKPKYASKGFPVDAETFAKVIAGERVSLQRIQLAKRQVRSGNEMRRVEESRIWHGISAKRRTIPDSNEGETEPWNVKQLLLGQHLLNVSPAKKRGR